MKNSIRRYQTIKEYAIPSSMLYPESILLRWRRNSSRSFRIASRINNQWISIFTKPWRLINPTQRFQIGPKVIARLSEHQKNSNTCKTLSESILLALIEKIPALCTEKDPPADLHCLRFPPRALRILSSSWKKVPAGQAIQTVLSPMESPASTARTSLTPTSSSSMLPSANSLHSLITLRRRNWAALKCMILMIAS